MFHLITRTVSAATPPWPWLSSRLFSTSSLQSSASSDKSFMLSYLISTCGFPRKAAVSISNRMSFETSEKPDAVIAFLKNHGLSETMTFKVLRMAPRLLVANPERTLQPKIDFFKSKGFSTSDTCKIIVGWPPILSRSLRNEIIPCFDFLHNMLLSEEKLVRTVISYPAVLCDLGRCIIPNVKLLRDGGVPESNIVKFIQYFPQTLKVPSKKFKERVQEAKEMEFEPLKLHFIIVVHVMLSVSKTTWARREVIYRKWGWTDDDIAAAFRVYPFCISVSDNKIEAIMDFLVNTLGCKSSDIARYPSVLSMSLKKRVIPRGSVVLALISKGLINKISLSSIFQYNELVFLDKFVHRYENDAAELLKLYQTKLT